MPEGTPGPKEMGYYVALAQVGLEMVAPIVVGVMLDRYLGWTSWGTVVGAVLGLVVGLTHIIPLVNRHDRAEASRRQRDEP